MTQITALPPVAKSFVMNCTKCEGEKFHTVITHVTASSAKVVCEICKKKSTFKIGAKPRGAGLKAAAEARRAAATTKAQAEHAKSYQSMLSAAKGEEVAYSTKATFLANQKLNHPKFGQGVVSRVLDDRIEVVFADDIRQLIHMRS